MATASGRQALIQDITIPLHGDPSEASKRTLKNTPQHLKITNLTQVKNYYILVEKALVY